MACASPAGLQSYMMSTRQIGAVESDPIAHPSAQPDSNAVPYGGACKAQCFAHACWCVRGVRLARPGHCSGELLYTRSSSSSSSGCHMQRQLGCRHTVRKPTNRAGLCKTACAALQVVSAQVVGVFTLSCADRLQSRHVGWLAPRALRATYEV